MKVRRVKFVWGASRVIKGRWYLGLFGLYTRSDFEREGGLAISVRGLLLWGGGAAVAAYLAGATALYWLWSRNPYSSLTYADAVLYPVRRAEVSAKKGRIFIAQGLELYRENKYAEAVNLLRIGLSRYPHDFRARLTLAQFYTMTNQRPIALRVLQEGLTDEYPGRSYLEALFNAAELGEDFELVAATAARYIPLLRREGPLIDLRWVSARRFAALTAAERMEEALQFAESEEPGHSASERQVLALLLLGRADDAIARLADWRTQPGASPPIAARLEVRAFREAKRFEEMERALAEMRSLSPGDPAPLVYAVVQQAMAGREEAAAAALEDFLFRFGGSSENLVLVATPLAEIGNQPLLKRCVSAAAERGFPRGRFEVLLVQALLLQGEWAEAAATLAALPPESGTGRDALAATAWREWARLLTDAARSHSAPAQAALIEFIRSRPWPPRIFRQTVAALLRSDRLETARDVVAWGQRGFPESEWFRKQAAGLETQLAARAAAAAASSGAPAAAWDIGEEAFFDRLAEMLNARDWTAAERHLRQGERIRPEPPWIAKRRSEMQLAQVRIDHAQGEIPEMLSASRLFLNGDHVRSQRLLDVAGEFFAQADRQSALLLAREVVRRTPDFSPAAKLLQKWEPEQKK